MIVGLNLAVLVGTGRMYRTTLRRWRTTFYQMVIILAAAVTGHLASGCGKVTDLHHTSISCSQWTFIIIHQCKSIFYTKLFTPHVSWTKLKVKMNFFCCMKKLARCSRLPNVDCSEAFSFLELFTILLFYAADKCCIKRLNTTKKTKTRYSKWITDLNVKHKMQR